jgi:hypothetical protein
MILVMTNHPYLRVGHHIRGLHRVVLHGLKRRRGLRPPFLPEAQHGDYTCSRRKRTMDGGRSDHSGHNNGSTTGARTAVEHRPPPRMMACFLRGAMGASPRSTSQRRARGDTMAKQASIVAQSHEPVLNVERILTVDFA